MLVISAKGIIYDVPEKDLKKFAFPRWIDKKDEIKKMFGSLSKVIKESSAGLKIDVEGQGCCGSHPNWCPPGGGER
ncbi:MAG TPA: hypothetical protein VF579_15040 [Candidatus Methylomirabilis sp.]